MKSYMLRYCFDWMIALLNNAALVIGGGFLLAGTLWAHCRPRSQIVAKGGLMQVGRALAIGGRTGETGAHVDARGNCRWRHMSEGLLPC